jgi:hypothetical protein
MMAIMYNNYIKLKEVKFMENLKYDYFTCVELAKEKEKELEKIFEELDEYAEDYIVNFLLIRKGIDVRKKCFGKNVELDLSVCEKIAIEVGLTLEQIFDELEAYNEIFHLSWLANKRGIDYIENIVDGSYTSVWEGEGEITARARINLNTREVEILESFDPADCYTEDGDPFECEFLYDEYVTFNGENHPCHRYDEDRLWKEEDNEWEGWNPFTGFYYR